MGIEEMKAVDIRNVDPESLVDVTGILISDDMTKKWKNRKRLVSGGTPNTNSGLHARNPEHKRFALFYAT